jgi:hypothetical protein
MELRLSEKQGAEFRLLAPDEPEARAAFETAHLDLVQSRAAFIAALVPSDSLFGETGDEDAPGDDDAVDKIDEDDEHPSPDEEPDPC